MEVGRTALSRLARRLRPTPMTLTALAVLLASFYVAVAEPGWLKLVRAQVFDAYQRLAPRDMHQSPVAIVDIDEASLAAYGQWPWPRTLVAELLEKIAAAGAAGIGLDIVFPEPDRTSPAKLADIYPVLDAATAAKLRGLPDNDEVLAATLARLNVAVGRASHHDPRVTQPWLAPPPAVAFKATRGTDTMSFLTSYGGMVGNVAVLEEGARGHGLFVPHVDADGVIRRVPLLARVGDRIVPALSAEMLRLASPKPRYVVKAAPGGIESVVIGGFEVRTDGNGAVQVYYSRPDAGLIPPARGGRYVPAVEVLDGSADPARLRGKLVLVGTSAAGLKDQRSTPVSGLLPGVEIHANILETILSGQDLQRPYYMPAAEAYLLLACGLLLILIVPRVGWAWTLVGLGSVLGGMASTSWWLFIEHRVLYDVAFGGTAVLFLYGFLVFGNYVREAGQRRQIRGAFGRYLSPALVDRLAANPDRLRLGGETRDMTILFADIRGFTSISEKLTAEELTRLLNRYLTPMTDVILARRGTIDKYMGDAIMAFWNAPLDDPDHAGNACRAALAMMGGLAGLNATLEEEAVAAGRTHAPLRIGIGLNSGTCVVGNMGSDRRFDYSVLGDTVNLASRLEGQCKTYGVDIVAGDATRHGAPDMAWLEIDLIRVKGKAEPVRIHCLLGDADRAADPAFAPYADRHAAMLAAYRAQDWDGALAALDALAADAARFGTEGLAACFRARVAAMREAPPAPGWDGVFVATEK